MKKVVCFGEVLWDNFRDSKKPGGAPMNAALHLFKNAVSAVVISSVGKDTNGEELRDYLEVQGLSTEYIQQHPYLPTGLVEVELDEKQQASYTIMEPVAWDEIHFSEDLEELVRKADALLFGSLASRNAISKSTLLKLIPAAKLRVFDLNLRPPHINSDTIKELLSKCDVLKLNGEELEFMGDLLNIETGEIDSNLQLLAENTGIKTICVTMGGDGAAVYHKNRIYKQKAFKVAVADTVGAGDAFLATFLAGFLKEQPIETVLERACAAGALVASKQGANPDYSMEDITELLLQKHLL